MPYCHVIYFGSVKGVELIPERLCGMDGQWTFSSPEKPKQTAQYNNLVKNKPRSRKTKNITSVFKPENYEAQNGPLSYPFLMQFGTLKV
jgi:hypothetical protein